MHGGLGSTSGAVKKQENRVKIFADMMNNEDDRTSSRECLLTGRGQNAEDDGKILSGVSITRKRPLGRTGARRIFGRCCRKKSALRSSGREVEED